MAIMLLPTVLGEVETLGTFKKGECIELIQNCANCTYGNFTSVYNPDMDLIVINQPAEKTGSSFNYSFCGTGMLGRYIVNGIGDTEPDKNKAFSYDFYITTEGLGMSNYVVLLIILIFAYLLLIMGFWKEEVVLVTLGAMGIIVLGIYIQINGISDIKSWITNTFGIINWAIGAYVLVLAYGEEAVSLLGR